jgi:hypothetical protein
MNAIIHTLDIYQINIDGEITLWKELINPGERASSLGSSIGTAVKKPKQKWMYQ